MKLSDDMHTFDLMDFGADGKRTNCCRNMNDNVLKIVSRHIDWFSGEPR